ncbi:MAG: phage minor head protein [Victivallaceae bacterium]|nr:phage minor head protein [Victivallaceae bacterium]
MMTFDEANAFLRKRKNLPTELGSFELSEAFDAKLRAQSFFSARVSDERVLEVLRRMSDKVSKGEIDVAGARVFVKKFLAKNRPGQYDPEDGSITNLASTARLNLIFEQNAKMAAAVGRYEVDRSPEVEERWPSWRYITGARSRADHARLDGKVYLKSDPFWHKFYPPWEFNCNCDVENSDETPGSIAPKDYPEEPLSGYKFDPAHAFESFDTGKIKDPAARKRISGEMKQKFSVREDAQNILSMNEKTALKPSGTPVSNALLVKAKNAEVNDSVRAAIAAVDSVHGDGQLAQNTTIFGKSLRIGLQGETVWKPGGKYYLNISNGADRKALTCLHELGHFLDWSGLSDAPTRGKTATISHPMLEEWRNAVKKTETYKILKKRCDQLEKKDKKTKEEKEDLKHYRYLLSPEELFARGYAQYIAGKCSDVKIKEELDKELKSGYCRAYHTQWDPEDFKIVSASFDKLFLAKGWIK